MIQPWTQLRKLCIGDPDTLAVWFDTDTTRRTGVCVFWIVVGTMCFGAAVGAWRAPEQALYCSLKLPLLVMLTTIGTALLNGILAQLLGAPLSFRQSALAVVMSYCILATIVGSVAPLVFFAQRNLPAPLSPDGNRAHDIILLETVIIIALAGIIANIRLFQLLKRLCGDRACAIRVLVAWLGSHLFLGAQLSWNMRPFIGSPDSDVQFLRDKPFNGTFYESVFYTFIDLI